MQCRNTGPVSGCKWAPSSAKIFLSFYSLLHVKLEKVFRIIAFTATSVSVHYLKYPIMAIGVTSCDMHNQ